MLDIATTIFLAAADSVNPCTLAIQAALLATLLTKSRRDALIGGLLFTLTIFIMYFLYGLGLLALIIAFSSQIKIVFKALLLILAALEIYAFINYSPGFRSIEMPMFLRPYAKKLLSSVNNPLIAIPIAVLLSLFLLPCSSGPYLPFLGLLGERINWGLMFLYLFIFVLPMLIITFLVYFGLSPEKVREWRDKNVRYLHLVAGILLLIVFFIT